MANLCLHSRHKLIRYNKPDQIQQIWKSFVSDDLLSCFFVFFSPSADGQKRKKSLRRKLDSLAKEKSKDKGTPSCFDMRSDILPVHRVFPLHLPLSLLFQSVFVTTHSVSPSLSSYQPDRGPVCVSTPQAGEQRGYKNSFCLLGFNSLYLA